MNLRQRLLIFLVKRCFVLVTTSCCFSLCRSQQFTGTLCNESKRAHESECDKYYVCDSGNLTVLMTCGPGSMFNSSSGDCDINRNESWCQAIRNPSETSPTSAEIHTSLSGVLLSTSVNTKSPQSTQLSTGTASNAKTTMNDTTRPTETEETTTPIITTISAETTSTQQDTITTAATAIADGATVDASSTTASTITALSHHTKISSVLTDLSSGTSTSTLLFASTKTNHDTTLDTTHTDNISHTGLSILSVSGIPSHVPTFSCTTKETPQPICITPCVCGTKLENTTLDEFMNKILTEMAVDRKNTSAFRRKYISAKDNRPSAQSIGVVGVTTVVAVILLTILADLSRLCCKPAGKMRKVNAQV